MVSGKARSPKRCRWGHTYQLAGAVSILLLLVLVSSGSHNITKGVNPLRLVPITHVENISSYIIACYLVTIISIVNGCRVAGSPVASQTVALVSAGFSSTSSIASLVHPLWVPCRAFLMSGNCHFTEVCDSTLYAVTVVGVLTSISRTWASTALISGIRSPS